MRSLEEIREAAMRLTLTERAALAEELFESVAERPGVRGEDLKETLAARLAALERGDVEVIDAEESLAELRRTLAERNGRP